MRIGSNLSLRVTAILIGGFVLLQLVVFVLMTLPAAGNGNRPYNFPLPDQVAVVAITLEEAAPPQRAKLIETFNESLYRLNVVPSPKKITQTGVDAELTTLAATYRAALPGRAVAISGRASFLRPFVWGSAWPVRLVAPVTLTVALRNGDVLIIDSRPSPLVRSFMRQRALIGAVGGIIVLIALAFAIRQVTRPIVRLSRNVRQFATALDAPDLPIDGSREMRDLATAYNAMKARIVGLIGERTRILAAVAHDMRTYLTRLRLRVEFIEDGEQRDRAITDLDEMAMLLDDTLIFAQQDQRADAPRQRVDLMDELRNIASLRVEMGQPVTFDAVPVTAFVLASPLTLRRVFANLIDNALRHGTLISIQLLRDDDEWQVSVADDGPGVPPAMLTRLGQPYERVDSSRDRATGGAGLGLAIVRALLDPYDGRLILANRVKGGFVATVCLPRAE